MEIVHKSVLAAEVLQGLAPTAENMLLVDCTLGEGGHTELFLNTYPNLRVCGIDADVAIQAKARERLKPFGERVVFHSGWFDEFWAAYPLEDRPDRILFDFGISIFHYLESGRGFSFSRDEPLDMRLDTTRGRPLSAVLEDMPEHDLLMALFEFGEERYARRITKAIVAARGSGVLQSSASLAALIYDVVPADYRHGRLHPATRSFQAFRILMNGELDRIPVSLEAAFKVLKPGGILGVITFHSLEDRPVKQYFRDLARECRCPPELPRCTCGRQPWAELLTKKPVVPTEQECASNPPSRSAKLRCIRKLREMV